MEWTQLHFTTGRSALDQSLPFTTLRRLGASGRIQTTVHTSWLTGLRVNVTRLLRVKRSAASERVLKFEKVGKRVTSSNSIKTIGNVELDGKLHINQSTTAVHPEKDN